MSKIPYPNAYWIGGSPCSGKTSVADALAARHCLGQYNCDEAYERHRTSITPDRCPVFYRISRATSEEVWLRRGVEQQVEEELEIYREEFPLILADLATISTDRPQVVEGAALLPSLVAKLGVALERAIWIVPTEAFQLDLYSRREWRHDVVRDCSDPIQAWQNWMARDAGFAKAVAEEARSLSFKVVTTDGSISLAETVTVVEEHFRL